MPLLPLLLFSRWFCTGTTKWTNLRNFLLLCKVLLIENFSFLSKNGEWWMVDQDLEPSKPKVADVGPVWKKDIISWWSGGCPITQHMTYVKKLVGISVLPWTRACVHHSLILFQFYISDKNPMKVDFDLFWEKWNFWNPVAKFDINPSEDLWPMITIPITIYKQTAWYNIKEQMMRFDHEYASE